jgi:hypothetical protein
MFYGEFSAILHQQNRNQATNTTIKVGVIDAGTRMRKMRSQDAKPQAYILLCEFSKMGPRNM